MSEDSKRYEKLGLGYEEIEKDGQVSVEKGVVRLRRVTGEDTVVKGTAHVSSGDQIYWTADCTYTRTNSK